MARGQGRLDAFYQQLAGWFDNSMDRLSGSYKRRARVATFLLGLAFAGAFNVGQLPPRLA